MWGPDLCCAEVRGSRREEIMAGCRAVLRLEMARQELVALIQHKYGAPPVPVDGNPHVLRASAAGPLSAPIDLPGTRA